MIAIAGLVLGAVLAELLWRLDPRRTYPHTDHPDCMEPDE